MLNFFLISVATNTYGLNCQLMFLGKNKLCSGFHGCHEIACGNYQDNTQSNSELFVILV